MKAVHVLIGIDERRRLAEWNVLGQGKLQDDAVDVVVFVKGVDPVLQPLE